MVVVVEAQTNDWGVVRLQTLRGQHAHRCNDRKEHCKGEQHTPASSLGPNDSWRKTGAVSTKADIGDHLAEQDMITRYLHLGRTSQADQTGTRAHCENLPLRKLSAAPASWEGTAAVYEASRCKKDHTSEEGRQQQQPENTETCKVF